MFIDIAECGCTGELLHGPVYLGGNLRNHKDSSLVVLVREYGRPKSSSPSAVLFCAKRSDDE